MIRLRTTVAVFAVTIGVTVASAQMVDGARYNNILDLIDDNLHFTGHFRWAVTGQTIADLCGETTPTDIPILIEMLGDDDARAQIAASGLLATFGDATVPALEAAKESSDYRVSAGAYDALIRLEECVSNPAGMNPDACPRY
jgi:hypothetical protein